MNKQRIVEITVGLALLPALIGYYANYKDRWIISLLAYTFSFGILMTPAVLFACFKCFEHCLPFISHILVQVSGLLKPVLDSLSANKLLGPCLNLFIRCHFFVFFIVLLLSDQLVRKVLSPFTLRHATNHHLSVINVGDAQFFSRGQPKNEMKNEGIHYSLSLAHQLCIASKLAYEDVEVVRHELEQGGYTVDSFKPIGYKNTCAYVIEKDMDVFLVFRGTNPLNIQNYVTNLDAGLTETIIGGHKVKVHKGFWDAMGATAQSGEVAPTNEVRLNLSHTSLSQSLVSAIMAILSIIKIASFNIFQNVTDPIDASWLATSDVRYNSLYSQAEHSISKAMETKRKRLFVTGHSLGGALATAKMIQSSSKLLDSFEGLYTFGQPNIGDPSFGKSFPLSITRKIFNHTYNNDVVPRIPFWYSPPPGTLVFIDSSYKITLYIPPKNQLVPVRPISYLHPSGLLNTTVISRLKNETSIRILFRVLFPFFINDHFPSEYSDALLTGDLQWIVMDEDEEAGDKEADKNKTRHAL